MKLISAGVDVAKSIFSGACGGPPSTSWKGAVP